MNWVLNETHLTQIMKYRDVTLRTSVICLLMDMVLYPLKYAYTKL